MSENNPSTRRLTIQATPGNEVNFGPGHNIASDVVALIYSDGLLVGWGDDYGTVTHPDRELPPTLKAAAERFVDAASELWAAMLDDPAPPNATAELHAALQRHHQAPS